MAVTECWIVTWDIDSKPAKIAFTSLDLAKAYHGYLTRVRRGVYRFWEVMRTWDTLLTNLRKIVCLEKSKYVWVNSIHYLRQHDSLNTKWIHILSGIGHLLRI